MQETRRLQETQINTEYSCVIFTVYEIKYFFS